MTNPPEYPHDPATEGPRPVDTLVAVGPPGQAPTAIEDIGQYERLLARHRDQPLTHVIQRREGPIDAPGKEIGRFEIVLPPVHFVDFGARLTIEPISGIQQGSLADRAGFRMGDRIVKVDDKDDFDPMRLPSIVFDHAGKPMTFEVDRPASDGSKVRQTINVTPDDTPPWTESVYTNEALEVPGLGLCYPVTTHVVAVAPGTPAARAGLKAGDVINSMTFPPRKQADSPRAKASKSPPVPRNRRRSSSTTPRPRGSRRSGCSRPARPRRSPSSSTGHRARSSLRPRPIPRGTSPREDWFLSRYSASSLPRRSGRP